MKISSCPNASDNLEQRWEQNSRVGAAIWCILFFLLIPEHAYLTIKQDLNTITKWAETWKMQFNPTRQNLQLK